MPPKKRCIGSKKERCKTTKQFRDEESSECREERKAANLSIVHSNERWRGSTVPDRVHQLHGVDRDTAIHP